MTSVFRNIADHRLELRAHPSGHRRADDDLGLAGVAGDDDLERGEHRHERVAPTACRGPRSARDERRAGRCDRHLAAVEGVPRRADGGRAGSRTRAADRRAAGASTRAGARTPRSRLVALPPRRSPRTGRAARAAATAGRRASAPYSAAELVEEDGERPRRRMRRGASRPTARDGPRRHARSCTRIGGSCSRSNVRAASLGQDPAQRGLDRRATSTRRRHRCRPGAPSLGAGRHSAHDHRAQHVVTADDVVEAAAQHRRRRAGRASPAAVRMPSAVVSSSNWSRNHIRSCA